MAGAQAAVVLRRWAVACLGATRLWCFRGGLWLPLAAHIAALGVGCGRLL